MSDLVLPVGKGNQRLDDFPLDLSSRHTSLAGAQAYVDNNPTAYEGQPLSVFVDGEWQSYIVGAGKKLLKPDAAISDLYILPDDAALGETTKVNGKLYFVLSTRTLYVYQDALYAVASDNGNGNSGSGGEILERLSKIEVGTGAVDSIVVSNEDGIQRSLCALGDIDATFDEARRNGFFAIPGLRFFIDSDLSNRVHTHILTPWGDVWNFGNNAVGQLGRAVESGTNVVNNFGKLPLENVRDVYLTDTSAVTNGFAIFVTNDWKVYSCGGNDTGQLGRIVANGTATAPNLGQIPDLTQKPIKKVHIDCGSAAGNCYVYVLYEDGEVWNWGDNAAGQLGRVATTATAAVTNVARLIIDPVEDIYTLKGEEPENNTGSRRQHHLAGTVIFKLKNGQAWSCGNNAHGQLCRVAPNGSATVDNLGYMGSTFDGFKKAICVYCAYSSSVGGSTFIIVADGSIHSAGYNNYGQLGRAGQANGSPTVSNVGQIPMGNGFDRIRCAGANDYSSIASFYAINENEEAWSWGYGSYGVLGRNGTGAGSNANSNLGKLPFLIKEVVMHNGSAWLLQPNGDVQSCGYNAYAQLGRSGANGSVTATNIAKIEGVSDVAAIICSDNNALTQTFVMFITTDGELFNTGGNTVGQLGRSQTTGVNATSSLGHLCGNVDTIIALRGTSAMGTAGSYTWIKTKDDHYFNCGANDTSQLMRSVPNGTATVPNFDRVDGVNKIPVAAGYETSDSLSGILTSMFKFLSRIP